MRSFAAVLKRSSQASVVGRRGFASADEAEFTFPRPFKAHLLDAPPNKLVVKKDDLLKMYRQMVYFRRFELVADTMYKQRLIRGFCHLYDGQEAVLSGMEASIKNSDSVITSYRAHCHQMSRGDTAGRVMAELMGKSTGCSKGKGGSMHMYYTKGNFYGGNGIVGAQVPLGLGLGFAHKYRKDGGLAVAAYGDGAANQGQVAEAFNMAALWKVPIIFLCENNEFGMGTAVDRASAATKFYKRGDFVPGLWFDGMDVLASKSAFAFAANWCRSGKGPIVLEASTYRYHGHSMSDPGISYRKREEVEDVKRDRDCIDMARNRLLEKKWITPAEIKEIDQAVRKDVDASVAFAKEGHELPVTELFSEVYQGIPPPFIRTVDINNSVVNKQ